MRPIFDDKSLIEWLAKQPSEGEYDYGDCGRCLLARYFTSVGIQDVHVNSTHLNDNRALPSGWDQVASMRPWTFGAAAARARLYLSRHEMAVVR